MTIPLLPVSRGISVFVLIAFINVSCKKPYVAEELSSRDSIMSNYFQILDSLSFEDTLSLNFQLLKAYHRNDTAFLRQAYRGKVNLLYHVKQIPKRHRCDTDVLVNVMDGDEGYRFSYSASFCEKVAIITVQKALQGMVIESVLYQFDEEGCRIIKHNSRRLDDKAWHLFKEKLKFADFWGLREINDNAGLDGSSLNIFGFKKSGMPHDTDCKEIRRWSPENTAIGQVFKHILDLSDIEADCFHYQ